MDYEFLDWDSNFFGLRVAVITNPNLSEQGLKNLLRELKEGGARLVYWPSAVECDATEVARLSGILVDVKTTFSINLNDLDLPISPGSGLVEPYTNAMRLDELEALAVQSGEQSRFALDPNIPLDKFEGLYKSWIRKSVQKLLALEVLVIRHEQTITGMITLGEKNNRGDIGLIAVDKNFRDKKYGEKLVRAAQQWFSNNHYHTGQVVTQGQNIAAKKLYLKCGYKEEHAEYFYHFWL